MPPRFIMCPGPECPDMLRSPPAQQDTFVGCPWERGHPAPLRRELGSPCHRLWSLSIMPPSAAPCHARSSSILRLWSPHSRRPLIKETPVSLPARTGNTLSPSPVPGPGGHEPGRRWAPALAHPLVRAVTAPAIPGVPAVALRSTVALRVVLVGKSKEEQLGTALERRLGHHQISTVPTSLEPTEHRYPRRAGRALHPSRMKSLQELSKEVGDRWQSLDKRVPKEPLQL